jgi:MFS family permease
LAHLFILVLVILILKWRSLTVPTGEGIVTQTARIDSSARLFGPLIYSIVLASAAAQYAIVPIMPVYAHRLGLSGFQQGMVLGATGLATLVVSVPAGTLADRFGPRRLTLLAGMLMAISMLAQSQAASFPALLGSRLAFGLGYGVVWTAGMSWLADARAGGSSLGRSVASAGVGGVAGPVVSGALTQAFGLAAPLLATAAGFAVITVWLGLLRVNASHCPPAASATASLRAAASNRNAICAAAAIVVAGITTGVSALLVPVQLHAAGASSAKIGLAFSIGGMLFVAGSTLTAAAGRRALRLPVICGGMLVLAAAVSPAALTVAPAAIVVMLCATTATRSVLWTVSYPLAAEGARQSGASLGVVMGMLNGIWAAMAVLGPLLAGLAAENLSPQLVFGFEEVACFAVLAAATAAAWRTRQPAGGALSARLGRQPAAAAAQPAGDSVPAQAG